MATHAESEDGWADRSLETPELGGDGLVNWESLWLYRRKQGVQQRRPIFTGDVFQDVALIGDEEPATVVVLQHPCSLLGKNNELRAVLLIANLIDHAEVHPKDWSGNYDIMPIVVHGSDPLMHQAVALDQLGLVVSSELDLKKRIACMETNGVTLLLQRWTNMNTRVVVPCWRFEKVIEAQFAEAEGMEAWSAQRQQARVKHADAIKEATDFLDEKSEDTGEPRRELFKNSRYRKSLVRRMHNVAKDLSDRENADTARLRAEQKAQREATKGAVATTVESPPSASIDSA